ncbi:MAG: hypothetical protein IJI96_00165 [Methanobrevibacter sp.]|nr:hypothetical protein [Methanobrevibacter sp.]MBQ6627564.1 hypothetical protein [Methanobrevibacter sp.]
MRLFIQLNCWFASIKKMPPLQNYKFELEYEKERAGPNIKNITTGHQRRGFQKTVFLELLCEVGTPDVCTSR